MTYDMVMGGVEGSHAKSLAAMEAEGVIGGREDNGR